MDKIKVSAKEIANKMNITIEFIGGREWSFRLWVARYLIALAVKIAWMNVKIYPKI
jgi:hypothetical protein